MGHELRLIKWDRRDSLRWILVAIAVTWTVPALALSGSDIATLLNRRYQLLTQSCGMEKPAWYCSGLLVRDLTASEDQFWKLTPTDTELQSVGFTYLREDVQTSGFSARVGMVLADLPTAVGDDLPYSVRCIYPLAASPRANDSDHGCNLTRQALPPHDPGDDSSCTAVGITTADQWISAYLASAENPNTQCSFSAEATAPFIQSMLAHNQLQAQEKVGNLQLLVAAWNPTMPSKIPIEALFYNVSSGNQLVDVQRKQRAYFKETAKWLPILRFQPGNGLPFGFDETDQMDYGNQVVKRINSRFFDSEPCSNGKADFWCNGVLIRVTSYGSDFRSWNPSPNSVASKGVSFSYVRSDLKTQLGWSRGVGIIVKELNAPAAYPLTVLCVYPTDGDTWGREEKCGPSALNTPDMSGPCREIGVTTVPIWSQNYVITSWPGQCFMGVTKDEFDKTGQGINQQDFQFSIDARLSLTFPRPPGHQPEEWNEAVIDVWPLDIPEKLPLEAIFYTSGELIGGSFVQADYFQHTGRFLPLINVDLARSPPFIYQLEDQFKQ